MAGESVPPGALRIPPVDFLPGLPAMITVDYFRTLLEGINVPPPDINRSTGFLEATRGIVEALVKINSDSRS